MSEIDEIKARLDIIDYISTTVNLRRSGKNYVGFCPFHANTRTPSFYVFPETGTWHCFGCHEGGDLFSFAMKKEGLDFKDTLQRLAQQAGVELHGRSGQSEEQEETHQALRTLLEEAVTFFQHNLRSTPGGQDTLAYLTRRGLNDETIERFGLGYSPASWDVLTKYFLSKGRTQEDLLNAGLASARDSGDGIYDRFRNRLMFPIRNERGGMAGFGARALAPDDVPKYLNSPQTALFDKGRLLYGFDMARKPIRSQDQVVIVEGYMDAIALHQHGFSNTVSPMGTALNEYQLRTLKRTTRRIVLALDPDAAGSRATMRGLEIARQTLDRESEPVFDAHGWLHHEARLQADIRVASLPDGLDPDEIVQKDPAAWKEIIEKAKPIVAHVMDVLAASRNLEDPKEKDDVARQVLDLIEDIPSSIERETYRQRLARLLKVDERALTGFRKSRPKPASARNERNAPLEPTLRPTPAREYETHLLGVLLREPALLFHIDRAFQENDLERLTERDFQHEDYREIFTLLRYSLEQDETEPYKYIQNKLSSILLDTADELYNRTEKLDPEEERVLEDLIRTLIRLRRAKNEHQKHILDAQITEAQDEKDDEALQALIPALMECVQNYSRFDHVWNRYIRNS